MVDAVWVANLATTVRAKLGESTWQRVWRVADVDRMEPPSTGLPAERFEAVLVAIRDQLGGDEELLGFLAACGDVAWRMPWLRQLASPALLYRLHARSGGLTGGAGSIRCTSGAPGVLGLRHTGVTSGGRLLCLFRQARLMRLPTTWGLPSAIVRETACRARGEDACVYSVHWVAHPRWTSALVAAAAAFLGLAWIAVDPWLVGCGGVLAGVLARVIETGRTRAAAGTTRAAFGDALRLAAAGLVETPEPGAKTPDATGDDCVMRQEGDFWRIAFEGKVVLVQTSRGLSLLAHLLRNPGQDIHVTTLDAIAPSEGAVALRRSGGVEGSIVYDLGDSGEVLDADAKAAYRRRVVEVREELDDAEACNDPGRTARSEEHTSELQSLRHLVCR